MLFEVTKSSDWDYKDKVYITTLEELMDFAEENGGEIILQLHGFISQKPTLEIYDTWRE